MGKIKSLLIFSLYTNSWRSIYNLKNIHKPFEWFVKNQKSSITTTDSIIFPVKYLAYKWIWFSYHSFHEIWFQLFSTAWLMIFHLSNSFSTLWKCFPLNSGSFFGMISVMDLQTYVAECLLLLYYLKLIY